MGDEDGIPTSFLILFLPHVTAFTVHRHEKEIDSTENFVKYQRETLLQTGISFSKFQP